LASKEPLFRKIIEVLNWINKIPAGYVSNIKDRRDQGYLTQCCLKCHTQAIPKSIRQLIVYFWIFIFVLISIIRPN